MEILRARDGDDASSDSPVFRNSPELRRQAESTLAMPPRRQVGVWFILLQSSRITGWYCRAPAPAPAPAIEIGTLCATRSCEDARDWGVPAGDPPALLPGFVSLGI
ncbi:hypothetical protein AAur_pTC20117 (plasmid) [Paenarthrobacter aurescens TC1]|uniref:Uncharacterized protein n=1 Tax=Paenarthrobacter aurescens (strain TC1) TaxID=290340 RepID=A1RDG6_PAEAT|nr:hypothetical protein AAur_pTC20117 [Paenarthrobacter aurescens TC1]